MLEKIPDDVVMKVIAMLSAAMIVGVTAVNKQARLLGTRVLQERMKNDKQSCVDAAGNYCEANIRLFIELFHMMHMLQSDQEEMVDSLPLDLPLWMLSNVNIGNASVHLEPRDLESIENHLLNHNPDMVVACLNYSILGTANEEILHRISKFVPHKGRRALSISECADAMAERLNAHAVVNSRLAVFMVPNRLSGAAIFVRRTPNLDGIDAIWHVTLSFVVVNYQTLQEVQGLLLMMGEARSGAPDMLTKHQAEFKEQDDYQKPDVEIYLAWERERPRPIHPPTLTETVSRTEEWQIMREAFQELEVYSSFRGTYPVAKSLWDEPLRFTVFKALRIYEYSTI